MLFQLNAIEELNFRKGLRDRAYVSGRCKPCPRNIRSLPNVDLTCGSSLPQIYECDYDDSEQQHGHARAQGAASSGTAGSPFAGADAPEIADQDRNADEEGPGKDGAGGAEERSAEAVDVEAADPHGSHPEDESDVARGGVAKQRGELPQALHLPQTIKSVHDKPHSEK